MTVVCPQGHANEPGSRFCGLCGAAIATAGMVPSSGPGAGSIPPPPPPPPWGPQPGGYGDPRGTGSWAPPHVASTQARAAPATGPIMALVGAAVVAGSAFLPWLGSGPGASTAFDVPFAFLWSQAAAPSGFTIGLVGALVAGLVAVISALAATGGLPGRSGATLTSLGGGVLAAVVLAFSFQTIRIGGDLGIAVGDILADFFGLGAWGALGGVILVGVGARLRW